jgi:uracil-DNA glycosylase
VQGDAKKPRTAPAEEDFDKSVPAFFEVLKEYKPDLVIAWGKRLWENLPDKGESANPKIWEGKHGSLYFYKIDDMPIPVFSVYHPSYWSFSYDVHEYLQKAINWPEK